jgi:SAM-dependent methyltransferase
MPISEFIAGQLSRPSGVVGRLVMGPMWNGRNRALNEAAFEALALRAQDRVLEVGFGGGYLLGRMAVVVNEGLLAGVDASMAMARACRRRHRALLESGLLEISCAGAESLPYPNGRFSKVCSVNSIFYWGNAARAMAEFGRVLNEAGMLVLCFTCRESLAGRGFSQHGLSLYDGEQVQEMMALAGFQEVQSARLSDRHRQFLCMRTRKQPASA